MKKTNGGMGGARSAVIRWNATAALAAALLSTGCAGTDGAGDGVDEQVAAERAGLTVTANQSLLITMTSVTRDSERTKDPCSTTSGDEDKVWTIGHMLKREAQKNSITPSTYVNGWMNAWTGTVTINGQTVPPLTGPLVRTFWQRFAGSTTLSLHKAPFYLLAIVYRPDLREHRPLNEPLGGEVRFVFGILAPEQNNPACPSTRYDPVSTVILEYSPAKGKENDVRDFARRWLDLSSLSGSSYRAALASLTEEVIQSGQLLRIRTNEGPIGGKEGGTPNGWDLGEFEPNPSTKLLQRSTIKQSPTMALAGNDSQRMSDWIWANRSALFANAFDYEIGRIGNRTVTDVPIGSYSVPNTFPQTSTWFRGSLNGLVGNNEFWSGPMPTGTSSADQGTWTEARFRFSVGTCRGCHGQDTMTQGALHILPMTPGSEAGRSQFLSGPVNLADAIDPSYIRSFSEMFRRENDLRGLVNGAPVLLPVFGNNYTVRFHASGKCLDLTGNSTSDGAFSQLYACHGEGNQRLSLVSAGTNLYNLKYKHSGKCIDVENASGSQNASTANGARVVQRSCSSSRTSQKLTLSVLSGAPPATPSPRLLRFQHSNLCLLVQNQGTSNGTSIIQGTCPASNDYAKGFNLVE